MATNTRDLIDHAAVETAGENLPRVMSEMPGPMVRIDPPADPMLALIRHGIDQKLDPESLKGLYELARQVKRDQAEEEFRTAMTQFQAKCPIIPKRKAVRNDDGFQIYKFAPYEDLMRVIAPLLAECGLTVDFNEEMLEGGAKKFTCFISKGIHTKSNSAFMPPLPTNKMVNVAQAAGQQQSYGRRRAITAGLNLTTEDEDDDTGGADDVIGDKSVEMLNNLMIDCEKAGDPVKLELFLAVKKIESLDKMRQADLPFYIDMLTRKHRKALAKGAKP